MKSFLFKIKDYLLKHKIVSLIILLVIIFAGYKLYAYMTDTSSETHYLISAVSKGTILQSVSGTGQVSASNQIELKPKASGDITYLGAKTGDYVTTGQLLLQVDSSDAEVDLKNAKINLQKMIEGAGMGLGGSSGLAKDYEDSLSNVDGVFSDLIGIMSGFDSIINNYRASPYKMNLPDDTARVYYDKTSKSYYAAKNIYDKTLIEYKSLGRPLTNEGVAKIVNDTYVMLQSVNQLAKDANVYLSYTYKQLEETSQITSLVTDKNDADTWFKTINSDLASVGVNRETLKNSTLNIESQKLSLQQKENAYRDHFLYAPISGLVQIDITKNDLASNGVSIGTLVSNKKIATVSLNEVDIVKVKVGQKATLTFDAIPDLTIAGEVAEVDIVGTVSQGVVNYNVKVAFDTQDLRVKSGMSVSAVITSSIKQDVLTVPSGAVKTQGLTNYVEVVSSSTVVTNGNQGIVLAETPVSVEVTTGLSDDTSIEVISGLKEGDKIVTKTIAGTSNSTKKTASSGLFGSGSRTGGLPH
ncbi:MAG: HlyD family efflux transporter periplasmic adaptor subunit [Candidatus Paceibacterota bacterium]|jgi:HlyD family secretion protein